MGRMPINLVYLKYFCDAVRTGSVSASARENAVSQSAISQGIAKLERSLGKQLITHQMNTFQLTREGQKAFKSAHGVFDSVRSLEDVMADSGSISGRIEFACTHSFALALLSRYLKKAQRRWPDLTVNFRLAHTDVIKDLVKKGAVDFGFVLDNDDFSAFESFEIYSGEHKLYVSRRNPPPKSAPYLLSEERLETNRLKNAYRKLYGKELPVLMEISSWEVIASLVEDGLGIGFIPDYVALRKQSRLEEYPTRIKPMHYKILAIVPRSRRVPRSVEAFLELFKDLLQKK